MSRRRRPQYGLGLGRIPGVALPGALTQTEPACAGVHLRSVLRFVSGFHPTWPHGKGFRGLHVSLPPHAVASDSRLPPTGPAGDLHPQSPIHAQRTQSPYGLPPFAPTTLLSPSSIEPFLPPPWTSYSALFCVQENWGRLRFICLLRR